MTVVAAVAAVATVQVMAAVVAVAVAVDLVVVVPAVAVEEAMGGVAMVVVREPKAAWGKAAGQAVVMEVLREVALQQEEKVEAE